MGALPRVAYYIRWAIQATQKAAPITARTRNNKPPSSDNFPLIHFIEVTFRDSIQVLLYVPIER